ncbi:LysR family transcriptional regulator [Heliomarina baculiformis]|uniref:LysR family transcriptional regulator n=1 Tax=Heliomarina baculiformis TaxID=2872036 RepID=UPI002354C3CA|nr:LysR family transcriptional regulator [Heliomarina baculiformis]
MNARQLKHFLTVAETLHFGRAAELLGMTQPPLSQSIMSLEQELGAPLFLRSRRHVELTPFGAQWAPHVASAIADLETLPEIAARLIEGRAGSLSLSFVSTADYSVLPVLVHRFRQLYPDVNLSLTEATSDKQTAALSNGVGHAGIIIPPNRERLPQEFFYRRLIREPLVAAVPESWINEKRLNPVGGQLKSEDVIASPLIVFPRDAAPLFHDLVTEYYAARGASADVIQHAIQMQTIISLVSAGMGIALVPQSLRHLARTGVRYIDLEGAAPELETGLIWRRDDNSSTLANLLELVEEMELD